jgi:AcrR family transcriptional regulator
MRVRGTAATPESKSTRDLILDAAEARFAERGFSGVSVREIAADVGLKNQASLYHHFQNKRALYEAVLARGVEALVGFVASGPGVDVRSDATGIEVMERTLDRVIDYLIEHPHLPRLIQRAGIDDTRHLRGAVTRLLRPLFQQGVGTLAVGGAPWRPEELPHVAAGMYHLIFGYFASAQLLGLTTQSDWLSATAVERQRRFVKLAVAQLLGARPSGPASLSRRLPQGD